MPVEPIVDHSIVEHLPAAGLLGLAMIFVPVVKDLIIGWWKTRSGEVHSQEKTVTQQIAELRATTMDLRTAMVDVLAKLRGQAENEEKEHSEIKENMQRNNETLQRMEVALARLDRD